MFNVSHDKIKSTETFMALLRAGLWEHGVCLTPYEPVDYDAIYQMADEQAVVGLIAAGLELVRDKKILKKDALPFLKKVFSIENRNLSMNSFIESLIEKMHKAGIRTLLVKGQGIAQCYERPQWRSAGDIDLFFDNDNYERAKSFACKEAESIENEGVYSKHLGLSIDSWPIELHGTLRCGLSHRVDRIIDSIQKDTFENAHFRSWRNGRTEVLLPGPDNDIIFIFTHFLKHFYKGGIGLRQLCDWCRLLWAYRNSIDKNLLDYRLHEMGLLSEWKAFAAFAANTLGMPTESIPLYDSSSRWKRKALRIQSFILKVGNFGQNRDMSYYVKYPYIIRKAISFGRRISDLFHHAIIFPFESLRFLPSIVFYGLVSTVRGE